MENKIPEKLGTDYWLKKSENDFAGRSDQNAMVVFPVNINYKKGDYVNVLIESCTSATLIGKIIEQN